MADLTFSPNDDDDDSSLDLSTTPGITPDVKKKVILVPFDAPVPEELKATTTTGHLLARLQPLGAERVDQATIVPMSGLELTSLAGAWKRLCVAKGVIWLDGLPGVRYDPMFTSAMRTLGIPAVHWGDVEDTIASERASTQRQKDTTPWVNPLIPDAAAKSASPDVPTGRRRPRVVTALAAPTEIGDDDDDQG